MVGRVGRVGIFQGFGYRLGSQAGVQKGGWTVGLCTWGGGVGVNHQ
jgi:hypothetical protein